MLKINAENMHFSELCRQIRESKHKNIEVENCLGHRYVASGVKGKNVVIHGTPGNALGAYLDGSSVVVYGNAQEATGDTMNAGSISIFGNSGDATGYSMRGGEIYVRGDVGYRAGIHMKAYQDKKPALVIGGRAGSFLGEYQAGGVIVVLGLDIGEKPIIGYFCGTGMHGGKIFLRCGSIPYELPPQVAAERARQEDKKELRQYVKKYCELFGGCAEEILKANFFVLTPNTNKPYSRLYTSY